ncbi:serine/threonine protein kinase [Chthoniobacter flavus Ellin428]|uniref:Serine/threonine protein kinase n=1 Tax=Chthoniobacter flavus Ellin428 TaxID=497964 RepID=B4CVR6_9BACT|nr:serine/threonine-protein kinase [Chthoniobacter flavus]EDY21508.1 serine/threonine protein kinase [Chthoniobacter flavus Ellin428]TCO95459.1 serine/threonine protein kinase [Chthoniobacter flavus]
MTATDSYPDLVDSQEGVASHEGQRVFERYVLEEMVGRGSMGIVWKAHDQTLDRIVALEFLPDRIYRDAVARDDLKRETRRCLELTHPNILRIHDFLEDGDRAAIALEYLDGLNLSELLMERPSRCFQPEELSVWVTDLCAAIDYAHEAGRCMHRELRPTSLVVNSHGAVKITGFGFALSTGSSSGGTIGYMSPQRVVGELPSPSDDIYSVGATLYELLTGKPPFEGSDLSAQIQDVIPESMAERRRSFGLPESAIPPAWEETIAACLAKDPDQRPASGREIARRLGLAMQPLEESANASVKMAALDLWSRAKPALVATVSRVHQQLCSWMGPIQQHRWQIMTGVATLCAILPWFMRSLPQPPPAPRVAPAVASAPVSPAAAVAPVAPAAPAVTPPASPISESPAIPSGPPLTADQRVLAEPMAAPEAAVPVRIETIPASIPFQVLPDKVEGSNAEFQGSGVSPATLNLPQGAYRIVYSPPGKALRVTSVQVPAAGTALFQQEFPHGVVKVHCQPGRAEVICDGRSVGAAPVDLLLSPGRHEIGARWDGRAARTKTIQLADASEQSLAFEFHARSSSTRSHHARKKENNSVFAKIGRTFKNLFEN